MVAFRVFLPDRDPYVIRTEELVEQRDIQQALEMIFKNGILFEEHDYQVAYPPHQILKIVIEEE